MKTTSGLGEQLLRKAAQRAGSKNRTPVQPVEEALCNRIRAASAPASLNLLVKPGWLKPGIDINVDDRNSLYDLLDDLN